MSTDSSSTTRQNTNQYNNTYYLHSNDHPGLQLVSDRLETGADFQAWRRSIHMALNVRNKLGFIDGKIPKPPDDDPNADSWSRCNDMVITWLINSVSKKIGQSLLFISTAEGIWNSLLARFKQSDAPCIYEIEQHIHSIQQGSLDISLFYTALITLWEEYKNYVELPLCTCGKCTCGVATLWEKLQEQSKVTKFLVGLNDGYEQTRRHILMLKPLPTMEEAYNIVAQDERQKQIKPTIKNDSAIFFTNSQATHTNTGYVPTLDSTDQPFVAAYGNFRPRQRPVCIHCGLLGHTVNKCYQIYGYPPGYRLPSPSPGQKSRPPINPSFRGQTPSGRPFQQHVSTQRFVNQNQRPLQQQS